MTTADPREAARIALDHARWEANFWARIVAEMPARVTPTAVTYVVTPETHRRLTEALAAEESALKAWQAATEVAS